MNGNANNLTDDGIPPAGTIENPTADNTDDPFPSFNSCVTRILRHIQNIESESSTHILTSRDVAQASIVFVNVGRDLIVNDESSGSPTDKDQIAALEKRLAETEKKLAETEQNLEEIHDKVKELEKETRNEATKVPKDAQGNNFVLNVGGDVTLDNQASVTLVVEGREKPTDDDTIAALQKLLAEMKKKLTETEQRLEKKGDKVKELEKKMRYEATKVRRASKTEVEMILKKHRKTVLVSKVRDYMRMEWFDTVKFVDDEWAERILRQFMEDSGLSLPEGVAEEDFFKYNNVLIKQELSHLRNNVQLSVRNHWMDDMKGKKKRKEGWEVPDSFPGCLLIQETDDPNAPVLHPQYRRKGTGSEKDFYYFASRILASITPKLIGFDDRKKDELISKMYSTSDEAFALIIIHNEYKRWMNQLERGTDDNFAEVSKRYCDPKSGNQNGWSEEGIDMFYRVCKQVEVLRKKEETGMDFETVMMERFRGAGNVDVIAENVSPQAGSTKKKRRKKLYLDPSLTGKQRKLLES